MRVLAYLVLLVSLLGIKSFICSEEVDAKFLLKKFRAKKSSNTEEEGYEDSPGPKKRPGGKLVRKFRNILNKMKARVGNKGKKSAGDHDAEARDDYADEAYDS